MNITTRPDVLAADTVNPAVRAATASPSDPPAGRPT
jgi:hypothetical protein